MSTTIYRSEDPALETIEVALVPVEDEGANVDSRALLYRFTWPY